jgi:hypothetical protein
MRAFLILIAALVQFGQRSPLSPAETLLDPSILKLIEMAPIEGPRVRVIAGSDPAAGEIVLACRPPQCEAVEWAAFKLWSIITSKQVPQPSRAIRVVSAADPRPPQNVRAAIVIAESKGQTFQVVRGLWSTAGIADEVVEVFARHAVGIVNTRAFESVGQPKWEAYSVSTTTIVPAADATDLDRSSFIAAAAAYFLATFPNAGAEALLSHLTVGAHARLAEDGRKAVAQMGTQQRASADVLIMFGQAIEREQRRMRSVENYMSTPVDPALHSRILDMEKGITSVWTSMGITSSPFVPATERIRGRGGEDRRIVTKVGTGPLPTPEPPTALLKVQHSDVVIYELGNFIDGKRSISDIRDAVSAEFAPIALAVVVDYFERLARTGAVAIR